jgi:5-methylcytosine-specific restriction protein A
MPTAPLHPCGPLCPKLVRTAHCVDCTKAHDVRRGSAASRGYRYRWRLYSEQFRREFPLCGMRPPEAPVTADSVCEAERRTTASEMTDHIVPVTGADDPRFYDRANHQALCDVCHQKKRQRESMAAR